MTVMTGMMMMMKCEVYLLIDLDIVRGGDESDIEGERESEIVEDKVVKVIGSISGHKQASKRVSFSMFFHRASKLTGCTAWT